MSLVSAPVYPVSAARLHSILPLLTLLLLAPVLPARISSAQAFEKVWQIVDPGLCSGCRGSILVDLNGDGRDEIITTGNPGSQYGAAYAMVYERAGSDFELRWTSAWSEAHQITRIMAEDHGFGEDGPEIYVFQGDGVLEAYDGQRLERLWSRSYVPLGFANDVLISDIDDDARLEVVIAADNSVRAFDLESAALEWEFAASGAIELQTGDVDDDGAAEVIVTAWGAALVGYVLDGRTGEAGWTYYGGFGRSLLLRDVTGDGNDDIIGQSPEGMITAIDVARQTPAWQIDIGVHNPWPFIRFKDVDADGTDELLVALASGEVRGYDALGDRSLLWTKQAPEDDQLTLMDVGDTDGDGAADFVGQKGYYEPRLVSGSLVDGSIAWTSERRTGPFYVIQGNVGQDLSPEVAVVNARTDRGIYYTIDTAQSDGTTVPGGEVDWLPYVQIVPRALTDLDVDGRPEMVFRVDGKLGIIDVATGRLLREWRTGREDFTSSSEVAVGDVEGDGFPDIAVSDAGAMHLLDGRTLEAKWSSIDTGQTIRRVWIVNTDDDSAAEIVFWNGIVQAYDGVTGTLEWQLPIEGDVMAIDVGDVNMDGILDAVVGDYMGTVRVVDGLTHAILLGRQVAEREVTGIEIVNIDETEAPAIVVAAGGLHVLRSGGLQSIWQSGPHGHSFDSVAGLQVTDVDGNGRMDILYATEWGIFRFESEGRYIDRTPPFVTSTHPTSAFERASVDLVSVFNFSESIIMPSETDVRVTADGEDLAFDLQYDDTTRRLSVAPRDAYPTDASIEIVITTAVTDTSGLPLDGNRNGRPDGGDADDFVLRFTTGSTVDVTGPVVHVSSNDLGEVWLGEIIDLHVLAADTSSAAVSNVAYVEVFVDDEGEPGTGKALEASGHFDSPLVEVHGRIRTESLADGPHQLVIRAVDSAGNWGSPETVRFTIRPWQRDAWTTIGGSALRSGSSSSDVRPPFSARWTVGIDEGYITPPIVADGRVYLGWLSEGRFTISAFEIASGEEIWSRVVGTEGLATGLTYAYGRIYLHMVATSNASRILALDAGTGSVLWAKQPAQFSNGNWHGPPAVHDGMVIVGSDFRVVALDARTGSIAWYVNEMGYDPWMPAASEGVVYSFWESHLEAYDVATGVRLWKLAVPFNSNFGSQGTVVIDAHSDLVFLSSPAELVAVDRATRKIEWRLEGAYLAPPSVDELSLYVTTPSHLQIIAKTTGELSREIAYAHDIHFGGPMLVGDYAYISGPTQISAIDKASGDLAWTLPVGGNLAVADGHAFVSRPSDYYDDEGGLYTFIDAVRVASEPDGELPSAVALHGSYPNPFNPSTTIAFEMPEASRVRIIVFDVVGREVALLVDEPRAAGAHEVVFDAAGLPSGVYFVRLEAGGRVLSKPVTLLK